MDRSHPGRVPRSSARRGARRSPRSRAAPRSRYARADAARRAARGRRRLRVRRDPLAAPARARRSTSRAARIRLELYTVNHLLAMHVRTGCGSRCRRCSGSSTAATAPWSTSCATCSRGFAAAWARRTRSAAPRSSRPNRARRRTYQLLAAGVERGVDLARRAARAERGHPRRAPRAAAQGRGAPAGRDAPPDDRDPRSDHVALHRRAAAVDRARASMTALGSSES